MGESCEDPVVTLVYDHFTENKDVAFPPQHLAPGDQFEVRIQHTCESAFTYAFKPVANAASRSSARITPSACPVENTSVSVCIRHEQQYGAYLVEIVQKPVESPLAELEGSIKDLSSVTLTVPVVHNPWYLDFTSGFTLSELTDPIWAGDTQTGADGMEITRIVRDRQAEDDANLGIAAFTHVSHDKWGGPVAGYFGPSIGLGIDERNEASYYVGLSWLMGDVAGAIGDRAALTFGYQWGSVDRLPAGVSVGDPIDDVNTLADLPTRIDGGFFFSLSFSFLGGRDTFEKKVASAGTPSGPETEVPNEQDDDPEPEEREPQEVPPPTS
jgi:hypothetical protein